MAPAFIRPGQPAASPACAYLEEQVAAGVLKPHDCEVAVAQFIDSCLSMTYKPTLFNAAGAPDEDCITRVVSMAVGTYLAAYRNG